MIEKWVSLRGIAEHLNLSKETIYTWVKQGLIPASKIGRNWRFKISEVDKWIKENNKSQKGEL